MVDLRYVVGHKRGGDVVVTFTEKLPGKACDSGIFARSTPSGRELGTRSIGAYPTPASHRLQARSPVVADRSARAPILLRRHIILA